MKAYRFYRVDRGAFVDVHEALCTDDEAALVEASNRWPINSDVEVWQQARFVACLERRAAA